MYLVAGMVARNYAGPGVVFSFIIAAVASIFSGKYGAHLLRQSTAYGLEIGGELHDPAPFALSKQTGVHCSSQTLPSVTPEV
jgi:hypothetical protein